VTAVLSGQDVSVRYGGILAVDRVSIDVGPAEIVGLVGANGAGKTSLLDCLAGRVRPDGGRILLVGRDVSRLGADARARRGVIRSFQDAWLFPRMTVGDVLLLAQERRVPSSVAGSLLGLWGWRDNERRRWALALAAATSMGLESSLDTLVDELSTGVRRTLDLACALALQPGVLLLDEPSAGLASAEVGALSGVLRQARDDSGAGVLMVEHDLPLVWGLADRVVVLSDGRVVGDGPPASLRDHPAVAFGG
jgi:ABC-type branched-subunit amino acid transport system ATPase component